MNFLTSLRTLLLALILSIGVSYAYATWSTPASTPPGGNIDAPVNIGNGTQYKSGALGIGGLVHGYTDAIFDGTVKVGNNLAANCAAAGDVGVIKNDGADLLGCVNSGGTYGWKSLTATGGGGGGGGCAPGSLSWTTPGTYTITIGIDVPSCVTKLATIKVWGAGGGGAAGTSNWGSSGSGGGGGGFGQVANYVVSLGQTFTVVVGSGGLPGQRGGNWDECISGQGGGTSSFGPFSAGGGGGGIGGFPDYGNNGSCGGGGGGGSASGPSIIVTAGGGGASGSYGDQQTGGSGGPGGNGGAGGAGAGSGGTPGPGAAPGGGGGGGFSGSGTDGVRGAAGASGQVEITW